jgi:hypothetical protein
MMPPNTSPVNFRMGRFRLPPEFKLWPDMAQAEAIYAAAPPEVAVLPSARRMWPDAFPALSALAFPETPPIPPPVASGDLITAVHENTVTEGISDLWIDLQWLAASAAVNPTTTKGDLIVNDGSVLARLPVGANSQILTTDLAAPLGIKWVTASAALPPGSATGDLLYWDETAAQWQTLDVGLEGTTLQASPTGSSKGLRWVAVPTPPDPWFYVNGALVYQTPRLNLIAGTGVTISGVANSAQGRADITINATASGGSQTPWTSDIDAANHVLNNVLSIGVGQSAGGAGVFCTSSGPTEGYLHTNTSPTGIAGFAASNDLGHSFRFRMAGSTKGSPAIPDTAMIDAATPIAFLITGSEKMRITAAGNVGIGRVPTTYPLEVQGDVNVTGAYRVNGVPISSGGQPQTPWASNINAANFNLSLVSSIGIGVAAADTVPIYIRKAGTGFALIEAQDITPAQGPMIHLTNDTGAGVVLGVGGSAGLNLLRGNGYLRSAGDLLFLNNNSVESMRITGAGNVGISTTTPGVLLSTGTSLAPIKIASYDQGPGSPSVYGIGVGGGMLTFGAGINAASGTPQMVLLSTGPLGLGTTAPLAPLHIAGPNVTGAASTGILLTRYVGSSSDMRGCAIYSWYDTVSTTERMAFAVGITANPYGAAANMTIDQFGNMGIGTGGGAIGHRLIILPAATPGTVAAANQIAIGETSNNAAYRLNLGYALVLPGNNWTSVIQSNVGGATGALCINPAGGQVLVGTVINPLNFAMNVNPHFAVTQAANLYLTLGLDPGGYAGSGVTGSGMWYDTTNNCMRLETLTGGVAWRGVTTCVNGGYFGIGIVAPQYLLSLGAGAQARKLAIYDNAGDFIGFGLAQATLRYDAGGSADHVWYTGSQVERMRITAAGNIGIATAAPACNLDVAGWIRATAIGTPPSGGKGVNIFYHGPNDSGTIHAYDYTLGVYKKITIDGAPLQLCGSFGAGNVAIGTVTPAYKLDVLGDVNCSGAFRVNGVPKLAQLEDALREISVRLSKLEGTTNQ